MNTKNPKQFPPFSMLESAAILLALILALNLAQPGLSRPPLCQRGTAAPRPEASADQGRPAPETSRGDLLSHD